MFDAQTIEELAAELHRAEAERVQIEQLSQRFPGMTMEDGYRVSRAWTALKRKDGRVVRGHKIGLTSRAMQQAAGICEPDYGTLLDEMFFAEGDDVPFSRFIAPKVEAELAFVMGRSLKGPGATIFDVLAATDFVVPAVEIFDPRIQKVDKVTKSQRKVEDLIADNAAAAGVVVGGRPVRPDAFDLRWVGAVLSKNAVVEETGIAAGVINHPANGIVWLVNKLGRWGEGIDAGEIVLGGSFTRPVEAAAGDVFHADYGSLGAFSFRFS